MPQLATQFEQAARDLHEEQEDLEAIYKHAVTVQILRVNATKNGEVADTNKCHRREDRHRVFKVACGTAIAPGKPLGHPLY